MSAAIELKDITKSFGSVTANKNINLSVEKGEILALLGENGSGKQHLGTCCRVYICTDSGSVFVDGNKAGNQLPEDSAEYGIGMVHQHFKFVERSRQWIISG